MSLKKPTFEECLPIIDKIIASRRYRWHLDSMPAISFEDIAQIIRRHIWLKWKQLDLTKGTVEQWVMRVANNQIFNELRNRYGNYVKPCNRCVLAEGNDNCRLFSIQDDKKCPLLKKWTETKKDSYAVNMPLPMEYHSNEVNNQPVESLDVDATGKIIHAKMKELLSPAQFVIYKALYIDHLSEESTAKIISVTAKPNTAVYNTIRKTKKIIIDTVRDVLYKGEIDFIK